MVSHVNLESARPHELRIALVAGVRLLSRVPPHVVNKVPLRGEPLVAPFVPAMVRFLACMRPVMGLKISFLAEALLANVALKGLLTSMLPDVNLGPRALTS